MNLDLQKLHALSRDFVNVIVGSAKKVPYSMRYLAREALVHLKVRYVYTTKCISLIVIVDEIP